LTTLERISYLMEERGWTKYRLAQECGMSLSSISNMYRRNTSPTVATIETVCKAFGITLSQFFDIDSDVETVRLTAEQKRFFDRWATLTPEQKELFFNLLDNMR